MKMASKIKITSKRRTNHCFCLYLLRGRSDYCRRAAIFEKLHKFIETITLAKLIQGQFQLCDNPLKLLLLFLLFLLSLLLLSWLVTET